MILRLRYSSMCDLGALFADLEGEVPSLVRQDHAACARSILLTAELNSEVVVSVGFLCVGAIFGHPLRKRMDKRNP